MHAQVQRLYSQIFFVYTLTEARDASAIKNARRFCYTPKRSDRAVTANINQVRADKSVEDGASCIGGLEAQVIAASPQIAQTRLKRSAARLHELRMQWESCVAHRRECC